MDGRQWDVRRLHSSAHHTHPRDVAPPPIETFSHRGVRGSYLEEREESGTPGWKRRVDTTPNQAGPGWETNVQTSLWLAQQNNLAPIASMSGEETVQSSQTFESEQVFSRDEILHPASNWSRDNEGLDRSHVRQVLGAPGLESSISGRPYKFSSGPRQPTELSGVRNDVPGPAAPQPRNPANIGGIEQRCEKCSQAEHRWRDCAASLGKLEESIAWGPLFEVNCQARKDGLSHDRIPYVKDVHQIYDLIQEAGALAKSVLREAPSHLQMAGRESSIQAYDLHSSLETMKRRFLSDSQDDLKRQRRNSNDINASLELHEYSPLIHDPSLSGESPRQFSNPAAAGGDTLPPMKPQSPYRPSTEGYGTTLPSMKPPPTPGRQLPSSPGRSHPSPPTYNIPSPSSLIFGQSGASTSAPLLQSSFPNILHPLSPTPSSSLGTTTAIQAHTAALQHEVSVKKYALQTLQIEHDKLLAALRRSQARARALEEKQVASDLEINTLAEERVRLLTQVQELEQNIAEVSKSREEFRQAAVKGGAQYVKIVRMASQLEMMASEERREWKKKIEEKSDTIEALQEAMRAGRDAAPPSKDIPKSNTASDGTGSGGDISMEEFTKEIQRLGRRCAEMEAALWSVRSESYRFSEAMATLSLTSDRIQKSVGDGLGNAVVPPAERRSRGPDARRDMPREENTSQID